MLGFSKNRVWQKNYERNVIDNCTKYFFFIAIKFIDFFNILIAFLGCLVFLF